MTVRRNVWFLVITLVLVFGAFFITLAGDHQPVLGLDLQGGTSVVLSPVGKFKPDTLDVAIDIIRSRVDTFGTLEPEITRQGSDIVIDLPGIKDRDKAIALVGKALPRAYTFTGNRLVITSTNPAERWRATWEHY